MRRYFRFFAIILPFAFCLLPAQAAWQKQNSGTLAWLHGVYFTDAERGFAVGANGTVLRTTNGGSGWERVKIQSADNLRDIVFTDAQTGWILAERDVYSLKSGEARTRLFHTTDGGATWRAADFPGAANVVLTRFVYDRDRTQVWAIGETGALFALSKGSSRWQKQTAPAPRLLTGGAILADGSAWLAGAGATLVNTRDDGATWREIKFSNYARPRLNAVFFFNAKNGWIAGAGGKIFNTKTGGNVWREQISGTDADLLDAHFTDERNGFIAGDNGTLLRTTNGGASWTPEKIKITHRLERLFLTDDGRGWAVGFGGTILALTKDRAD